MRCAYCEGELPKDGGFHGEQFCTEACFTRGVELAKTIAADRERREAEELASSNTRGSPLTMSEVERVVRASLSNADELAANEPIVRAEVIQCAYGFNVAKLEANRARVLELLAELPDPYFTDTSEVGASVYFMGQRRDQSKWTNSAHHIEALCGLAIGLGVGRIVPSERPIWSVMPKGLPFFACSAERKKTKAPAEG